MYDSGLAFGFSCLLPGFVGWLGGIAVALAVLLREPKLGGGSWLTMLLAESLWFYSLWPIGEGVMKFAFFPLDMCIIFTFSFAMSALPAVGLRKLDEGQRSYLYGDPRTKKAAGEP